MCMCLQEAKNMKELSQIISENLIFLRKKAGMTQLEFGEKFSYTDKTVSRWENGSIVPSVDVLKQIADYYGVTVDFLINEHHSAHELSVASNKSMTVKNKAIFLGVIDSVIWTVALVIYFTGLSKFKTADPIINIYWITFLWAIPFTFLVTGFFLNKWFSNRRWAYICLSASVWTILLAAFITFLREDIYWFIFIIGVPIQVAIILLMHLRSR